MMIKLKTEHPIAVDSPDHQNPWGTRRDNSRNPQFNKKLYRLFPNKILRVLDLGCAGGGFIQSIIEDGHIGVGLEGSDWSKNLGRGAWGKIPTLFTTDITKPFEIYENKKPMKFNVITAWEVMEHIKEKDLPQLLKNIKNHLDINGLFIASISHKEEVIEGHILHQTVKSENWWRSEFKIVRLVEDNQFKRYFNNQLIRNDKESSLYFSHYRGGFVDVPNLTKKERIMDYWWGSKLHKFMLKLLI